MSRIRLQAGKRWDYSISTALVPLQAAILSNTLIPGSPKEVSKQLRNIMINVRAGPRREGLLEDLRGVLLSITGQTALRGAPRCTNPQGLEKVGKEETDWLRAWVSACVPCALAKGDRAAAFTDSGSEVQAMTLLIWPVQQFVAPWDIRKWDPSAVSWQSDVYKWTTSGVREKDLEILKTVLLDGHPGVGIPIIEQGHDYLALAKKEYYDFLSLAADNEKVRGARALSNGQAGQPWFPSYRYYSGDKVVTTLLCKVSPGKWIRERRIKLMGSKDRDFYAGEELSSLTVTTDSPDGLEALPKHSECILRKCEWVGLTDVNGPKGDQLGTVASGTGRDADESTLSSMDEAFEKGHLDRKKYYWQRCLSQPCYLIERFSTYFRSHVLDGSHTASKPLDFAN